MITDLESMFKIKEPWPPKAEAARMAEIQENRKLREGIHKDLWGASYSLQRSEEIQELSIILNYPWLITKKTTDLLFGDPPLLTAGAREEGQELTPAEQYITELLKRLGFFQVIREACYDVSAFGEGILKVRIDPGVGSGSGSEAVGSESEVGSGVIIESNAPDIWIPIVSQGSLRKITAHTLSYTFTDNEKPYLKTEIHTPGSIEHRVYELSKSGAAGGYEIKSKTSLNQFEAFKDLQETQPGIPGQFQVIPIFNQRTSDRLYGISDYGPDLKSVLKALERSISKKQSILEKFADPSIVGPKKLMDTDPVTKKQRWIPGRYYGINVDPETQILIPQAVVWDAHLQELQDHITELKEQLFALSELPPVALASSLAGTAESGTALRLRMSPLLAKVKRFKEEFEPAIMKLIRLAAILEKKESMILELSIKWQDGLPQVPLEEAQRMGILKSNEIISRKAALLELGYGEAQAQAIAEAAALEGGI